MNYKSSLKRGISLKNPRKLKTSLELEDFRQKTPKKEERKLKENFSTKKKPKKEIKKTKSNNKPINFIEDAANKPKHQEKKTFFPSPNRPKDIINKLIMKKIDKNKFKERIKFVKLKLYEKHGNPYVTTRYILKGEETPPLLCDYYKINKLVRNEKCRLLSKYHDFVLLLNKNEYLIRYSPRKDYYVIMKYLLFFVYAYDRTTYCKKCQKYYDLNEVKLAYKHLVNKKEEEKKIENVLLIKPSDIKLSPNKKNYRDSKFRSTVNIEKLSESTKNNSLKTNKKVVKRHSVNFGFINTKTDLLSLANTKSNNKNHSKMMSNKKDKINEYFVGLGGENNQDLIGCNCNKPNYLFIADIPFKLIPNCLPNFYPIKAFFYNILDNYTNKIRKLKLNLNFVGNEKKNIKRKWNTGEDDTIYNDFFKKISFSSEDSYLKEKGKEILKKEMNHNQNRRLKNDNDIKDIENLIAILENLSKNNISQSDESKSSSEEDKDNSSKVDKNELLNMKSKFYECSKPQNKKNINNKQLNSFTSLQSNNFHSSGSSSVQIISNENEEINKESLKNFNNINLRTESPNSIIKNYDDNKKSVSLNKITESNIEKNAKQKFNSIKKLYFLNSPSNPKETNKQEDKKINSNIVRYKQEINKKRINLFKNSMSVNKNQNKRYMLSTESNKMRLVKNTKIFLKIKEKEYFPYIIDKNKKNSTNKSLFRSNQKSISIDNPNCSIYNSDSKYHSGKFNFKHTYEFAVGKFEESNKIRYKMNIIKEITNEFQKNSFLSNHKSRNQNIEFFPSIDFLINCRMKRKEQLEDKKMKDINNKRYLTVK